MKSILSMVADGTVERGAFYASLGQAEYGWWLVVITMWNGENTIVLDLETFDDVDRANTGAQRMLHEKRWPMPKECLSS